MNENNDGNDGDENTAEMNENIAETSEYEIELPEEEAEPVDKAEESVDFALGTVMEFPRHLKMYSADWQMNDITIEVTATNTPQQNNRACLSLICPLFFVAYFCTTIPRLRT